VRLLLHPAHSLPTTAAAVGLGSALAFHDGVFSLPRALLAFLASWFIHVAGLFWENYWLLTRHASLREHPEMADAVDSGALSLAALRRVMITWLVFGLVTGALLLPAAGVMTPVFGAIGIIAAATYAAGPFSITRLGIGEFVFFSMFGIVMVVGGYYVQAAPILGNPGSGEIVRAALPFHVFVIGLPLGAIINNVMLVDDLSDIDVDRAKGWRTRPVIWGVRAARLEYIGWLLVAYALPFWFWRGLGFSAWILLPLATLPLAALAVRKLYATPPADVEPLSPRTAALGLLFTVLLATGILLSR
jgi:1,4-dihydroxy-2-naphthoate octaprenyltransferase